MQNIKGINMGVKNRKKCGASSIETVQVSVYQVEPELINPHSE